MLPSWLKEVGDSPCRCCSAEKGKKTFVQKTLNSIIALLQETFDTESISKKKGFLQSIDPRAKLISTLAFVFALAITRNLIILLAIYLLEILLAYASKISIGFYIKRVWLFVPIFTLIIAIPMIFNIFIPGTLLVPVWNFGTTSVYITKEGVYAAIVFVMRVVVTVSAVVLLFVTTPQQVLFKSLRSVGVPKLYVLTLEMAYRYIFLLIDLIREIYFAKRARTIKSKSTFEEQKWVGGRIGYILLRSLNMSERIHLAMLSRGFNGDVKIMQDLKAGTRDYIACASAILLSILLALIAIRT
ncbi:MAG: cobalt ECF transporter T component CbiQ [Methanotrichaceae archaeon]|nr:cobalt ECF transporter T component CbiQ [Methanotrichaceae archaeon]